MIPRVAGLNCPNCGGPLDIRSFGRALNIVCPQCLSVLDATDPNLKVIEQFHAKVKIQPQIPLGSRAKLRDGTFEAIGFQVRATEEEGVTYSWREYLLFNPYKGFRYLTEYDGHWNYVKIADALPVPISMGLKTGVQYAERRFKLFSTADASTTYVLGEFPWQVRAGERVRVQDYISTPLVLSAETTEQETVWSIGEYTAGAEIWKAFGLPGTPPPAYGVFENQPSPYAGRVGSAWNLCWKLLLATGALAVLVSLIAGGKEVFHQSYSVNRRSGEGSIVTAAFDVPKDSNLQLTTKSFSAGWLYFHFAVVNQNTGHATEFGRQLDAGKARDVATVPPVPAGRYYLRIEPETPPDNPVASFDVAVRRGVPSMTWFWIAGLLILVPPAMMSWRTVSYETTRWQQSNAGGNL